MNSEFKYSTAGHGEPGWYCHVRPKPTPEHPLRARVSTPCAHAIWDSPDHARIWADHPGDMPHMVKAYIEWANIDEPYQTDALFELENGKGHGCAA